LLSVAPMCNARSRADHHWLRIDAAGFRAEPIRAARGRQSAAIRKV